MKIKSKRHRDTDLWHNKCVGNMNGNLLRPTSTKWIENISEYKETTPPLIQRYKDTKIQTALQPSRSTHPLVSPTVLNIYF